MSYQYEKCVSCGQCVAVCKTGAHRIVDDRHIYEREKCTYCYECIKECNYNALIMNAKEITAEELMTEIEKDIRFYKKSNGGVTFSGGEPLLQDKELYNVLGLCKKAGIETAIETAGNYAFEKLEPLLDLIDLVIIDCKAYSEKKHIECTGSSNKLIVRNIEKLSQMNKRMWVRIPVVKNINIDIKEMDKIAFFLQRIRTEKVELLPYHKMGIPKYGLYGLEYCIQDAEIPTKAFMEVCREILSKHGIEISVTDDEET